MSVLTQEMIKCAQEQEIKYGIPASITLGQIILESTGSGGGLSGLASPPNNNLFGVKGEYNGQSVSLNTHEEVNGTMITVKANFRKYPSINESIEDHSRLLMSSRYRKYTASATSVREYAEGIYKGGYATDSSYVNLLCSVIASNNLTQYDSGKINDGQLSAVTNESDSSSNNSAGGDDMLSKVTNIVVKVLLIGLVIFLFIKAIN